MQVIKFFQENAGAIEQLRGPIFEDKVVDYILSVAQVAERVVPPEELALPDAGAAVAVAGPEAAQETSEPSETVAADVEAESAAPAAAEDAENAA
jgi:trigger factor